MSCAKLAIWLYMLLLLTPTFKLTAVIVGTYKAVSVLVDSTKRFYANFNLRVE